MTLTGALYAAKSSLTNAGIQSNVTSRNIAGLNDPTYSRKIANLVTNSDGVGYVVSITRASNAALQVKALNASSGAAASAALSTGLDQISQTIGTSADGRSVSSRIASLNAALLSAAASPSNQSGLQDALRAAQDLASALNEATNAVQGIRKQADSDMATSVATINDLLSQFKTINDEIVKGSASKSDITDQLDARDRILTSLSQEVGISVVAKPDGGMAIYTDSGVALFDKEPRQVAFKPTATFAAGTTGGAVMIDGVDVTSKTSNMGIKSGNLFGLAQLRDDVSVQYQKQLDETARGLISAFAEADQSGGGGPTKPGLFTWSGAPGMPPGAVTNGLAADIRIAAAVDPAQGGSLDKLRDGGISGTAAYVYNSSGAASYSVRLREMVDKLAVNQTFDSTTGIGGSASVSAFAVSSTAWLEGTRKAASDRSDQQKTIRDGATQALTSITGVNMDDEMSRMLDIEHSYQASAKLISTIDQMFSVLFQAIG